MNTKAIVAIGVVAILLAGGAAAVIIILANNGDDDLPTKYDQREKGIVTPVKYQNPWGTCWSFGSTGAAEISVLTYFGKTTQQFKEENGFDLDFSEKHLAWFALNAVTGEEFGPQKDEGFTLKNDSDYHYIYDHGGIAAMAASLYSTGVGPVWEKEFKYTGVNGTTALNYFKDDAPVFRTPKDTLISWRRIATATLQDTSISFNIRAKTIWMKYWMDTGTKEFRSTLASTQLMSQHIWMNHMRLLPLL